jgi:hypothetical protein
MTSNPVRASKRRETTSSSATISRQIRKHTTFTHQQRHFFTFLVLSRKSEEATAMKRRGVRFEPYVSVVDHTASADEGITPSLIWYQREDFTCFRQERLQTMKALQMAQGETSSLDPDKYCLRGLEETVVSMSPYARERRRQQTSIVRMVLEAQTEQRQKGVYDPENIKMLSMVLSKVARDRAVEIGRLDASSSNINHASVCTDTYNYELEECCSRKKRTIPVDSSIYSYKRHKARCNNHLQQQSPPRHSPCDEIRSTTPSPE